MLDEARADQIIGVFKSLDVTSKLECLNEAREMQKQIFMPDMSNVQYAKAAMRIEQLYNIIRDELRVEQKRIKADIGEGAIPKITKAKAPLKPKKEKPTMDMAEMLKAFQAFNQKG